MKKKTESNFESWAKAIQSSPKPPRKSNIERSIESFDNSVESIVDFFCKKQELSFEFFVGDEVGGVACLGDWYINFSDILFDIRNNVEKDIILQWYDHVNDGQYLILEPNERPYVNYESYFNGARIGDNTDF